MKDFPLPVISFGPGSQDEDEAVDFIGSPGEMNAFMPPRRPEVADPASRDAAIAQLEALRDRMKASRFGAPLSVDLSALPAPVRAVVNEALGQGEVSATVAGGAPLRIQETVFAGLWRVLGEGGVDRVEAGPMPEAVVAACRATAARSIPMQPPPAGAMNAPAVLRELIDAAARRRDGDPAHIVNLTLLPMTPDDLGYLSASLGVGPVVILSRGYGNCRISSTALRDTWWVQYFNSSDSLILNTIEVTELPDVAPAAAEDYADSIVRLGEWIESLRED
ncbi:hydrogenase expression/formation protein [Denitromonas halophila]|uniref:Hydrogenase expression/formation protein n=1 Tax=Denitromonas halophila TaxID=1629404 RepID=A0A557R2G0_9RHOO|nr:hydrogenase expression/formation protein [Denitromonas halophila]TVO59357.1 hydrogenase expression/formation protein [Denitromonas halophila]